MQQQLRCFPAEHLSMFKVRAFLFKEILDMHVCDFGVDNVEESMVNLTLEKR